MTTTEADRLATGITAAVWGVALDAAQPMIRPLSEAGERVATLKDAVREALLGVSPPDDYQPTIEEMLNSREKKCCEVTRAYYNTKLRDFETVVAELGGQGAGGWGRTTYRCFECGGMVTVHCYIMDLPKELRMLVKGFVE